MTDPRPKVGKFFILEFFGGIKFFLVGSYAFHGLFGTFCVAYLQDLHIQKELIYQKECHVFKRP